MRILPNANKLWYPARLRSFDPTRLHREEEWEWIPEIAWPNPRRPQKVVWRKALAGNFMGLILEPKQVSSRALLQII